MGGLKPRAGTALANGWPWLAGVLWCGGTGVAAGAGTASATVWQAWQAEQELQSLLVSGAAVSGAAAAGLALPWQSPCAAGA